MAESHLVECGGPLEIKIVGDKLGGAEPIKPWPELLAVLATLPSPHPSTRISKELNGPMPRSSPEMAFPMTGSSDSKDHPILGGTPQRSSQIGVGFSQLPQFGVVFRRIVEHSRPRLCEVDSLLAER
jgi:hypothetical protein